MKKVLYFYPENPSVLNQGNNARAFALLQYFKSKQFKLDYVGVASKSFSELDLEPMKDANLIDNGFLLRRDKRISKILAYLFTYAIPNKLKRRIRDFDRTRFGHKEQFSNILKNNQYDLIIISYAYWAELIRKNNYLKGLLHLALVSILVSVNVFKKATKAAFSVSVKFRRIGFPLASVSAGERVGCACIPLL